MLWKSVFKNHVNKIVLLLFLAFFCIGCSKVGKTSYKAEEVLSIKIYSKDSSGVSYKLSLDEINDCIERLNQLEYKEVSVDIKSIGIYIIKIEFKDDVIKLDGLRIIIERPNGNIKTYGQYYDEDEFNNLLSNYIEIKT